jgi:putative drug exporter of the RND superfamily
VATLLYRLGRFSFRHPWRMLAVWLILMIGMLGGGVALGGKTNDSFAIPGTESQNAIDRLAAVFPSTAGASAQLVVTVPTGESVEKEPYKSAIESLVTQAAKVTGVDNASSPFSKYASDAVSSNKTAAIIAVQFTHQQSDVTPKSLADLKSLSHIATDAGMKIGYGGSVYQATTVSISPTEGLGVIFAGIVLFIAFGSLLAAGMPLLTAIVGIGVTIGGVLAASKFIIIGSSTPLLALMIGLAVGIDYGLFILSRHRNQLAKGMSVEESAATAVATAGSAVVFAGGTVIIALLGLLVVGIPFLSAMGVAAAAGVLVAIFASTTLLPAVLGLAGRRLIPKAGSRAYLRANPPANSTRKALGERWVNLVIKKPLIAVVAVIGLLGVVAIPAFSLQLALPTGATDPAGSVTRTSYDMIEKGFGPGRNGPLLVLVDITQTTAIADDLTEIRADLQKLPDVTYVSQGLPNATYDTAILQVIPSSAPDSPKTTALVGRIRSLSSGIDKKLNTPIEVTGATAVQIDISSRLNAALLPFGLIVVGLSILLLMMVFRSVFVPIKAAIGFLLSVFTSFGVVVAIFQWGWFSSELGVIPGPILSFLPILLMAVLFGLAMDYEVFLVSGMRESFVHTGDARKSIVSGFSGAARVVTAAALIMFFVFASFIPDGAGIIKAMAVGLAVGILADAFLVRMTLVPAAMALLGKAAWWMPKWLGRVLPNVDIEGERLREHRDAVGWAADQCSGQIITASELVSGAGRHVVGPLSLGVRPGALVVVSGASSDRRMLAATLSGRLDPVSGRAQVGGHPLPSESTNVARLVALEDIGGTDRAEVRVGIADLMIERLRLTQPWYRAFAVHRRARNWLDRVDAVLGEGHAVSARSTIEDLPQLERAVVLSAVALAEHTPVVMLDLLDAFADSNDEARFLRALDRLAPATTTIVLGSPVSSKTTRTSTLSREVVIVDLDTLQTPTLDRKDALA